MSAPSSMQLHPRPYCINPAQCRSVSRFGWRHGGCSVTLPSQFDWRFETAEPGWRVYVEEAELMFHDRLPRTSSGVITNVSRKENGEVGVIYAEVDGLGLVLGPAAVLFVVPPDPVGWRHGGRI